MSAIPAYQIYVATKPLKQARTASPSLANVLAYAVLFMALTGVVWVVSSLAGNVMVEKARRESLLSTMRAREARAAVAVLRRSIDSASSFSAICDWAGTNGFRAPDQSLDSSSIKNHVASNR